MSCRLRRQIATSAQQGLHQRVLVSLAAHRQLPCQLLPALVSVTVSSSTVIRPASTSSGGSHPTTS